MAVNEINEILKEQYNILPEELRKAISSVEIRGALQKISKKHGLHVDKAGLLEDEVYLVLLGLESPADFVENIEKALGLGRGDVNKIAEDVNEGVFMKVRESLKLFYGAGEDSPDKVGASEDAAIERSDVLKEVEEPTKVAPKRAVSGQMDGIKVEPIFEKSKIMGQELGMLEKEVVGGETPAKIPQSLISGKLENKTGIEKEENITEVDRGKGLYGGIDPYLEPIE